MASLKVNKALYLIVLVVVAVGLFTFNLTRNATPQLVVKNQGEFMKRAPTPKTADADTTADTLSAIKGHVASVEKNASTTSTENGKLREERVRLLEENKQLATRFESRLKQAVEEQQAAVEEQKEASDERLEVVLSRLDELIKSNYEKQEALSESPGTLDINHTDRLLGLNELPQGFGGLYEKGAVIPGDELLNVFWIEPLDESLSKGVAPTVSIESEAPVALDTQSITGGKVLVPLERSRTALNDFLEGGSSDRYVPGKGRGVSRRLGLLVSRQASVNSSSHTQTETGTSSTLPRTRASRYGYGDHRIDRHAVPHFTIPDTSLLANSTAITALVGKVYLDNQVSNPRLFKIKVGRDNVTSNGMALPPEIEGTIMEGFAVGEYSTSCVRGVITAATFVFRDGTVRSMYPGDVGSRPDDTGTRSRIGYISDQWGNDCIPGVLISDGNKYIAQSFALAGLSGYAEAWRASQENRRDFLSDNGTSQTLRQVPSENVRAYAEASALAGGVEELVDYIRQRHGVSTDLVYLPAGEKVDVHIQQELRIDVPDEARKLRHNVTESSHVKSRFD